MAVPVLLSWSSGKDSAWALHHLRSDPAYEVAGLFTTVTGDFDRVSIHGVRTELLRLQAESIGLPLDLITLPYPCSNEQYESLMQDLIAKALARGLKFMAFGDIFLEDVRRYREEKLKGSGIRPLFPIWGQPSSEIAGGLISSGFEAVIASLNPDRVPARFIGQRYNQAFLDRLPPSVDPCGENGEFHTFVTYGPIFDRPVETEAGEIVNRDGFLYADLMPRNNLQKPY